MAALYARSDSSREKEEQGTLFDLELVLKRGGRSLEHFPMFCSPGNTTQNLNRRLQSMFAMTLSNLADRKLHVDGSASSYYCKVVNVSTLLVAEMAPLEQQKDEDGGEALQSGNVSLDTATIDGENEKGKEDDADNDDDDDDNSAKRTTVRARVTAKVRSEKAEHERQTKSAEAQG